MRHRHTALVAVLALGLVVAAVPAATAGSVATAADAHNSQPEVVQDCAAEPPEDFAAPSDGNQVIGWVDGYWYNQPLEIDVEGGLSEGELERLSARTAARFEAMRCLTADEGVPPVEVKSREEFAEEQEGLFSDLNDSVRLADNAKFETMLIIGSDSNSTEVREQNRATTVGGSYNFRTDTITVVSDDPDSLLIDEEILVHEIGHAVQDQQFNISRYDRPTVDVDKGILSLIEGDVTFIENRYLDACENGAWEEPCVTEEFGNNDSGGGSNAPANWGLYFTEFQPYSDGPSLIQAALDDGGWEAVNALYEDPPQSAYFSAFPGTYGEVELGDIEVSDRSTDEWERLTFEDTTNYDTVGVAGISAMFKSPTYESQGEFNIYSPQEILNVGPDGEVDEFDPLNYNQPETEGWRDDKLYTYRNDDNETATVWEIAWASAGDAQPFIEGYERLIGFRNGERVDGYASTYTFGEDSAFDMALTVVPDGDRVTIVTAPSVEDLTAVHDVELIEESDDGAGENGGEDGGSDDGTDGSDDGTDSDSDTDGSDDGTDGSDDGTDSSDGDGTDDEGDTATETDSTSGPGFGVAVALVAILGAGLLARRRG